MLAALRTAATKGRAVHVLVDANSVEVRLSLWQKILGLLGNIRVRRADVSDVQLVEEPVKEAMATGVKVGLRLPWFYYVARTIQLDQAFVVQRGVPGLSFAINDGGRLKRVLVSTSDAAQLVDELRRGSSGPSSAAA